MLDEIGSITTRIGEIQQRLAALNGPPPTPAVPPAAPDMTQPSFQQALTAAQAPAPPPADAPSSLPAVTGPTTLPHGSDVVAPPASLGPLPGTAGAGGPLLVLPVSPPLASAGIDGLVQKYAAKHGLAPALVRAVIKTESDGNPRCVSRAGAMGLMQLMPENVREAGISDPFDPEQNIAAGTKQLADLVSQYHGDLDLALAGYNAGPGNVHKYGGVPPFTETHNYIHRVRAAMGKG